MKKLITDKKERNEIMKMEQSHYNSLFSFICNIANDVAEPQKGVLQ